MIEQSAPQAVSARLTGIFIDAAQHAGEQLSLFMERDVRLRGTGVERVRLEQLPSMLDGEDRLVTAIYLAFGGDIEGHVVLAFSPEMAAQFAAALLMEPVAEDNSLGPMEHSALGEIGNITTASFLNAVANACTLSVLPSPPFVVQDMVGALLDNVILELSMESSYALLLHTIFEVEGDRLQGDLVLLPSAASCLRLEEVLAPCN